eukprot:scaffold234662_cov66-Attheya_sp.AAC.1
MQDIQEYTGSLFDKSCRITEKEPDDRPSPARRHGGTATVIRKESRTQTFTLSFALKIDTLHCIQSV